MRIRNWLQNFFSSKEACWEIYMVVLAVIFVFIGFIPDIFSLSASQMDLLGKIDGGITIFFILEFVTRISIAPSRKGYLKEHWLDLIAIFPAVRWLRIARLTRVFRILRVARLVRLFNSIDRLGLDVARFGKMNGLQWMMLGLTCVMLIASVLLFFFEHPVNDKVVTYWDALYTALVTWTTPGYGDIVPITPQGRFLGLVLIISGLLAWGMFIANLANYLSEKNNSRVDPGICELQEKLLKINQLSKAELIILEGGISHLINARITQLDAEPASRPVAAGAPASEELKK